jgi:chloramphenicol 3-O-phosphotransferase
MNQYNHSPGPEEDADPGPRLTLLIGGARSGKSSLAETRALCLAVPRAFVATAEGLDDEMAARIARHRSDRGPDWTKRGFIRRAFVSLEPLLSQLWYVSWHMKYTETFPSLEGVVRPP